MRPPNSRAPESVIDLGEIRVLFEGDPDALTAFCIDVASAIESAVAELEIANGGRKRDAARAKAHELRGLAGNVGARRLAALCATYETGPFDDTPLADDGIRAIVEESTIVCHAMRETI